LKIEMRVGERFIIQWWVMCKLTIENCLLSD